MAREQLPTPKPRSRKPADEENAVRLKPGEEDDPGEDDGAPWTPADDEDDTDNDDEGNADDEGGENNDTPPPSRRATRRAVADPMAKSVEVTANDIFGAMRRIVREELDALVTPLVESNAELRKAYGDVVTQLNANTDAVDTLTSGHDTLTKSITTKLAEMGDPATLLKSASAALAAQESAAPHHAGAVVESTATPVAENNVLNKSVVPPPETPPADGDALGVMSAAELLESKPVMQKALALAERGYEIAGLPEIMAAVDSGRKPASEHYQKVKKALTEIGQAQVGGNAPVVGW